MQSTRLCLEISSQRRPDYLLAIVGLEEWLSPVDRFGYVAEDESSPVRSALVLQAKTSFVAAKVAVRSGDTKRASWAINANYVGILLEIEARVSTIQRSRNRALTQIAQLEVR